MRIRSTICYCYNLVTHGRNVIHFKDGFKQSTKSLSMVCFGAGLAAHLLESPADASQSYTNTIPPGISLIANQLDHGSNTADVVFSNTGNLDFSSISKWNCGGDVVSYFDSGSPSGFSDASGTPVAPPIINPGEAFFFDNESGAPLTMAFHGTPHVPVLPVNLFCGYGSINYLSRQTNDLGTYENIVGLPPTAGAQERIWNGSGYGVYAYTNNAWTPSNPPVLGVGQGAAFVVPTGVTPPVITQQPQNQTNFTGGTATFSVIAVGTPYVNYQWIFCPKPFWNFSDVMQIVQDGASPVLTLPNVQTNNAGDYAVVIRNASGSVTSSIVALAVSSLPTISYTNIIQPGLNLIANQLDHGSNRLDEILPTMPDGSMLYKYNNLGSNWFEAVYSAAAGSWTPAGLTLSPGEGAFLQSPVTAQVAFTGTPHVPVLPAPLPSGSTYLLSRQTNAIGTYANIVGVAPIDGDAIYQWNGSGYNTSTYSGGTWNGGSAEPVAAVGEAVWVSTPGGPPPPPIPNNPYVIYEGTLNQALGSANLSLDAFNNVLTVNNLGTPDNAVLIEFADGHQSSGVKWQSLDPSDSLPVGAYLREDIFGTCGSVVNGWLGTLVTTKAGTGNYVMTADFSPLGTSNLLVQAFNENDLVGQTNLTGGPTFPLSICIKPVEDWEWDSTKMMMKHTWWTPTPLPGWPFPSADCLAMSPRRVFGISISISGIKISTSQIYSLAITGENQTFLFDGLENTSVGNAILSPDVANRRLPVHNLGSSGQDGVEITLHRGQSFIGTWDDLDPTNMLPVGAYVESDLVGTSESNGSLGLPGVTNNVLGSMRCTKQGTDSYAVTVDYSPLGSSSHTIQVYNGSVLVSQLTGQTGSACAIVHLPPGSCTINPWLNEEWPSPTLISLNGAPPVLGTELLVVPEGAAQVDAITSERILAANIPMITMTGESVSQVFNGLVHTPLGDASMIANQLDHGSNTLALENIGSSGQDGVAISLNPGNDFAGGWQNLDPSDALPVGAYVQSQMIGTTGGITNGLLGSTRCTKLGSSNYVVSVDYSPLGSTKCTVQVYNGTRLAAELTGQSMGSIATIKLPPWICTINPYLNHDWPSPTLISLNGGPTVLGTELLLIPEGAPPVSVTAEQILAANIPSIIITNETVSTIYGGLSHTSLGNACLIANQLDHGSNTLTVANIGSSGQDGVEIGLSTNLGTYFQALWQPLDAADQLPVGAYIQSQLFGTAGSVSNDLLGWWRLTKLGTGSYAVTADYSAMGSPTVTVEIYNGSNLVATRTSQSGSLGIVAGCVDDDEDGNPIPSGPYGIPKGIPGGCLTMFGPEQMRLSDGTTVTGDRFVILPEGSATVSSLSKVQLLASGIPQIVITNEQSFTAMGALHNDTLAYFNAHNPLPPGSHLITLDQLNSMLNVNSNFLASAGIDPVQLSQSIALFLSRFTAMGMFHTNSGTIYVEGPVVHDQWVPFAMNYLSQQGGAITPQLAERVDVINSMTSMGASQTAILNYLTNEFISGPYSPTELQAATIFEDVYMHSLTYWGGPGTPQGFVIDHTALWDGVGALLLWETGPGSIIGGALMSEAAGGGQSLVVSGNTGFGGFTNTPLGGTLLDIENQQLVVSGVTASDPFGLMIPLNTTEGLDVHWQSVDPAGKLPPGAYIQENIIGTAGHITNGTVGSVTMTKVSSGNFAVSANFSPVGATTYTVTAYLNGAVVAQATNQSGAALATCNIWGDSGCIPPPPIFGGGWDWPTGPVTIGSATAICDHLFVTPEGVSGTATGMQILGSQVPGLNITSENAGLPYGGLNTTALGRAIATASTNRLTVSNLGSSGQDGVEISFPGGITSWAFNWMNLDPNALAPAGAYVRESILGTGGPVTNGLLGTVTTTKQGPGAFGTTVDFSPIGAGTFTTAVYNGTNFIHQVTGMPSGGGSAASMIDWSLSVHIYIRPFRIVGDGSVGPINIDPTGDAFIAVGNNTVYTPDTTNVLNVSAMRIECSQIPALSVTNETVVPFVLKQTLSGRNVQLQWMGSGVLQQSADLGKWNDTTNASSPATISVGPANGFYRVRQPGANAPF